MSSLRRPVVVVCGIAGASLGGCLLTNDFDGIAGTAPDAGLGIEGGADAIEEAGGDSSGDAGTTSPCTSGTHVFCTDFDDITAAPVLGWTNTAMAGTVAINATLGVSAPNALVTTVDKGDAGVGAYLLREGFVGTTFKVATFGFDFRIIDCPSQVKNSLTFVYLGTGPSAAYGFVILSSGALAIGSLVNGTDTFFELGKPIMKGKWAHLVMTLTPKPSSIMHLQLTVDGATAVDTDAPGGATKQTITVNVGIQGSAAEMGCGLAYDNVVLDKE
jgi:hypothetical protein